MKYLVGPCILYHTKLISQRTYTQINITVDIVQVVELINGGTDTLETAMYIYNKLMRAHHQKTNIDS